MGCSAPVSTLRTFRVLAVSLAFVGLASCGEDRPPTPAVEPTGTRTETPSPEPTPAPGEVSGDVAGEAHMPATIEEAQPPDQVTAASGDEDAYHAGHSDGDAPAATGAFPDEVGVARLVPRNRARMTAERRAPVHVIAERDAIAAGRRICEAVVPRRPPETPVLLKPNLSGINIMRDRVDSGIELRTTGIDFLRGVVQCLKARGHREITITDAWSSTETLEQWQRATGLDRLIEEEGVRFVGLWDDRGPDGQQPAMLGAPYPGARRLRTELMVPRVVARHLEGGLYISIPRMKMHRYAVMSLGIKNAMGVVVWRGVEAPNSRSDRMHAEIGPWLSEFRGPTHRDDRDGYIRSLELFSERMADVLEIELPDAVLIDGVPPVAGDGFALIEPFDEGVAIGSTNPVLADAVAMEWMGYLDNADLMRELHHPTSPLLEEAARRFYGDTAVLRDIPITGDDSFRRRHRVAHYRAFPGFEIGQPPRPMGELPWEARAITARRVRSAPTVDGALDEPAWSEARPVPITADYRGRAAGPETTARFCWTPEALFFAFECAYDELNVDEAAPTDVELENLYAHDALELFLDPSPRSRRTYLELEVSPLGHTLDIDVDLARRPRGDTAYSSGMEVRTRVDREARRFVVEGRVPSQAFGDRPLRAGDWRANVYRIAGTGSRTFMARYPTYTDRPNYHVPDRFGWLRLLER